MPWFYFDINAERDTSGVELADLVKARGEAIRAAGEMLRDIDGALSGQEWRMTVRDESGEVVLELKFFVQEMAQS